MAESVLSLCSDVATGVAWFCGSINVDYIRGRRGELLQIFNVNYFPAGGGNLSSESSDPNPVDFECAA
ncbi:hypothetical protein ACFXTO_020306 [Malus domestica]